MPLTMAQIGETNFIKEIHGKDDVRRHLNNLGFIEGATIKIITELSGNMIIDVKGARVAISRGMAGRIIVQEEANENT